MSAYNLVTEHITKLKYLATSFCNQMEQNQSFSITVSFEFRLRENLAFNVNVYVKVFKPYIWKNRKI